MRSIIGIPNASVLPEPVGDAARTSMPARASGKTSAWMANGDRMPSRASDSTTGALTPSAVNDWIKDGSFRVKRVRDARDSKRLQPGGTRS